MRLVLDVHLDDEAGAPDVKIHKEGVEDDGVVTVLLLVAEGLAYRSVRAALEDLMPGANGDVLHELAASTARLNVLHDVMHLPDQQ